MQLNEYLLDNETTEISIASFLRITHIHTK
jgi:hypothetical protein